MASYFVAWQFLNPFDLKELAQSMFASSMFASNIYFYLKTGYFDTAAELKPLLHTWSLSVEEQFYLIFPIFLLISWRFGKNNVAWFSLAFAITSLLASEWSWRHDPAANFYLIHTRSWELLAGSLAAFLVLDKGVQKQDFLASLGLAMIIFSIFTFDENTPIPSVYSLIPVLGTLLLIIYGDNRTFTSKLLGHKAFVGLGLISYSAYLWHQPIFTLARQYFVQKLSLSISISLIFFTLLLATLTWYFVEQPIRKLPKSKSNKKLIFGMSFLALGIVGSVGILGHFERGHPSRNPDLMRLAQNGGLSFECNGNSVDNRICKTRENPAVAVWGDSHAIHFVRALDAAFPERGVQQLTLSACPPIPNFYGAPTKSTIPCHKFNNAILQYLDSPDDHQFTTIIMSAKQSVANPELKELFATTINRLTNAGLSVVLVTSTPRFTDSEKCLTLALRNKSSPDHCRFKFSEAENFRDFRALRELSHQLGIGIVDLSEFMCSEDLCTLGLDGELVLRDAGHLTNEIQTQLSLFLRSADALKHLH